MNSGFSSGGGGGFTFGWAAGEWVILTQLHRGGKNFASFSLGEGREAPFPGLDREEREKVLFLPGRGARPECLPEVREGLTSGGNLRSMKLRHLSILLFLAALVILWESLAYVHYAGIHKEEHRRLGNLLLSSVEGILHQSSRRGMYNPGEAARILQEGRKSLGFLFAGLREKGGGYLFFAGEENGSRKTGPPVSRVARPFHPKQPKLGPGERPARPPWAPSWRGWKPYPEAPLELVLEYSRENLEKHLAWGLGKSVLESLGIVLALFFLFLFHNGRMRAARLEAEIRGRDERIRSMDFLGKLAAGLVHQTKNPLASIRGLASLLASGDLEGAEAKAALGRLVEEADRAVARLDEFLLVSRPAELRLEERNLKSLLEELVELVEPEVRAKGARCVLSGPGVRVRMDPEQARRLFFNLLLNAAAFVPEGGEIRVSLQREAGKWRVLVEDDGPGVPKEMEKTMFEPYVSRRPGGTGLGLAISRRIALEHGWDLRYERAEGGGARMIVEDHEPES